MTAVEPEPNAYVAEHIRDRLLRDPRVGELDLHIAIEGQRVVVTGHVSTVERCEAVNSVLAELMPDNEIRNEVTVSVYPEAPK